MWAWLFGAIVFLLCVNAGYALVELIVGGSQVNINVFSLIGGVYDVPVLVYVLFSVLTAAVSFGVLCSFFTGKFKMSAAVTKMVDGVELKFQHNREHLEKVVTKKFGKLSMSDFRITEDLKTIKVQLGENRRIVEQIGRNRDKFARTVKKQNVLLEDMNKKMETIEAGLTPKSLLSSRSDVQEISGVGDKIAEELKSVGVATVERLLVEDSAVIAQRTELSKGKIEKLQGTAQLLMIPGVDENKARLLQKVGVMSADKLASQNPILLFKKVGIVAERRDDAPTLEEIASYVKFARSNLSIFY